MTNSDDRRGRLSDDLHNAAARGEIVAVFQAQYSLTSGEVVAAEALSRWNHPDLGVVSPAEFIPIAEKLNLIDELGQHMLRLGCEAAADWQRVGHAVEVAVNVSLLQLASRTFEDTVHRLLDSLSLDPRLLTLEITETTPVHDVPPSIETLKSLHAVGINISIDDFGSENSSIEQVIALPATELKLDQSLVRDSSSGSEDRLAEAISFGKDRGLRLVAEGVESAREFERVIRLKCDRVQGFLLSRPLAKPQLDARIALV